MAEPWAPSLVEVGARIPTRTRSQANPGDDSVLGTFTTETVPTAAQVQPIIDGAVASVRHAVGTVTAPLYELAKDAAAWRAAADVELAWPERDADIREVYDRLNARATLALKALTDASQDSGTGADATMPVWAFPTPVPWGDDLL
ncbi:hypothetical protein ACFVH6_21900 [Spirillospora sp. NPDC127200]